MSEPDHDRLPVRQPARLLVVGALYVVAVLVVTVLLGAVMRTGTAAVLAVAWGMLLLVPLAVLAPVPRPEPPPDEDDRPLLRRTPPSR